MHGNLSLLNLDLAQHWQQEEIAKAAQRQAIIHASNHRPGHEWAIFDRLWARH